MQVFLKKKKIREYECEHGYETGVGRDTMQKYEHGHGIRVRMPIRIRIRIYGRCEYGRAMEMKKKKKKKKKKRRVVAFLMLKLPWNLQTSSPPRPPMR
jgi:hypothetical protein